VINTNLPPILHRFRDIVFDGSKIAIFGYPSCVQPLRRKDSLYHIVVRDMWLKPRCFGLHFCRKNFSYIFNQFHAVSPGCYRIRWNNAK